MISLLTLLLYPLAIQYRKGWSIVYPLSLIVLLLDILANYTELVIITQDFPKEGEYTFSKRLERLQYGTPWQQFVASLVIPYLNYFDPGHVKP